MTELGKRHRWLALTVLCLATPAAGFLRDGQTGEAAYVQEPAHADSCL